MEEKGEQKWNKNKRVKSAQYDQPCFMRASKMAQQASTTASKPITLSPITWKRKLTPANCPLLHLYMLRVHVYTCKKVLNPMIRTSLCFLGPFSITTLLPMLSGPSVFKTIGWMAVILHLKVCRQLCGTKYLLSQNNGS